MCIVCSPAFAAAFRRLSYPSRRQFMQGAGALAAGPFIAEAVGPGAALADGALNETIADGLSPEVITIYTAAKIITMEADNPTATAVAVSGTRIVATGSLDQVKAALGDTPYRIDSTFDGKVVLPGFIDQHLHPVLGALTLAVAVIANEDWVLPGVTYKAATSPEDYQARLRQAETKLATPADWLLTWGYHPLWHGKLDRASLDAISTTRPIAVWHRSCHEFFFNTPGLAALGLTEAMTQGKGQASEQSNWAEGHFWEGGLNLMVGPMIEGAGDARAADLRAETDGRLRAPQRRHRLQRARRALHPGHVGALRADFGAPDTPMYSTFLADGRGIVDRVGLDKALDATAEQIAVAPAGPGKKLMFFPGQVKLFADGAIISQLMQMKDGYLDGHHGEWILEPDELEKRARLYWNAGYQIHTHVNGDLGLDVVLGILEKLMAEQPRSDHRSVIVHFANSTEEQVGRIARLGALVSGNPYYPVGFADKYSEFGLGPARADTMVRANSVLGAGTPLSYHSDLPMAPSAPLYLAWCGVNRITPSGRVAAPEQRIGVEAALRAITIEAAYSWRQEDWIGSIAPGKIANFTVLEDDPLTVDPLTLKDIVIWGTVFEGRPFPIPEGARAG